MSFIKPIDLDRLVASIGEDSIQRLYQLLVDQISSALENLESAVKNGNIKAVHHEAHKTKGGAASACCYEIEKICAELEEYAEAKDWQKIEPAVSRLKEAFERLRQVGETESVLKKKEI